MKKLVVMMVTFSIVFTSLESSQLIYAKENKIQQETEHYINGEAERKNRGMEHQRNLKRILEKKVSQMMENQEKGLWMMLQMEKNILLEEVRKNKKKNYKLS